jgi:hypothetical protein
MTEDEKTMQIQLGRKGRTDHRLLLHALINLSHFEVGTNATKRSDHPKGVEDCFVFIWQKSRIPLYCGVLLVWSGLHSGTMVMAMFWFRPPAR